MAEKKVEHRPLEPGVELRASYKKQQYTAIVRDDNLIHVTSPEGQDLGTYKSLSKAGGAVTGGSVNGWRFWKRVEPGAEEPAAEQPAPEAPRAPKAKAKKTRRKKQVPAPAAA